MREDGYAGRRYVSAPSIPVRQKKRIRRGHCRFCGCTEKRACILTRSLFDDDRPITCSWANRSKTLCNAPICLRADVHERRAAAKARTA